MKIGIDLLWVRVGICGGTESYIRNLLNGLIKYDNKNTYLLFVARDNADSFRGYTKGNKNFALAICPTDSMNRIKRIAWENMYLDGAAKKESIDLMFCPVYSMPHKTKKNAIPYITVIHDLQQKHYPEYFSKTRLLFVYNSWKNTAKNADKIIVLSKYGEKDLIENYPAAEGKTQVIYNPIISNSSYLPASEVEKFGVTPNNYIYCVSSMLRHKNLITILKMLSMRKDDIKLVLSGVGGAGNEQQELEKLIDELGIKEKIIITGFVSNEVRDCLYENCALFIFPSIFEGFGMPPIEAMRKGKYVVMTDRCCLREVTKGKAIYVEDPFNPREWNEKVSEVLKWVQEENKPFQADRFEEYDLERITKQYIETFESMKRNQ